MGRKKIILNRGDKFTRLTVQGEVSVKGKPQWRCLCECGAIVVTRSTKLLSGHTKSCGCWSADRLRLQRRTHGMFGTRIYGIWGGMIHRCHNKNNPAYKYYGGRGITVCDEWRDFSNFYNDMLPGYDDSLSIDRICNDDGYYKDNCRWATATEQSNNRSSNVKVTYHGITLNASQWANMKGINGTSFIRRISRGWSIKDALHIPFNSIKSYSKAKALTPPETKER